MQQRQLKILTDEHIHGSVVDQLRVHGVDAMRVQDIGFRTTPDERILERATQEGRSVVSINYDFNRLHTAWLQAGRSHCGIFRPAHYLKGATGIGPIVTTIREYHDLIAQGAGTVEDDIYNRMFYIS